jgi:hypothetical protein
MKTHSARLLEKSEGLHYKSMKGETGSRNLHALHVLHGGNPH